MKRSHRHGNPPTLQTIERLNGQLYQTLAPRRLGNAGSVQIVKRDRKPAWLMRATLIIGALILISLLSSVGLLLPH